MITKLLNPDPKFWLGKRVLLTGHTGFKGAWMAIWLHQLGAKVTGISLAPATLPNLFSLACIKNITDSHFADICDANSLADLVKEIKPDIVFHMAAQALVHAGYRDPLTTFATNVQGTANLLDAIRSIDSVKAVVAVTTDKVYKNLENVYPYRETDVLGGHDPYSASKAASEMVIACYRDSYLRDRGIAVASARAGNVIGGGDWSADRLIPDLIRAWSKQQVLHIRRPKSTRPWQHVLDPLAGYLRLAELLCQNPDAAGAYNFGPQTDEAASVSEIVEIAQSAYGPGQVVFGDDSEGLHEASWLALEITKARNMLGLRPRWKLTESVQRTFAWYSQFQDGLDSLALCKADIDAYELPAQFQLKQ